MNYDKIGNFIAIKRKEKGLTQKDLATKLGVTDKAVSKWERGLGCPDVSILEILSKELEVSILEILKGRIIENEVIKVTEMNDYVQDTIDYSKNKNKENIKALFSKILIILIVFVGTFLIILNINHIIYLNKSYEYNFDNIKYLQKTIEKIEKNIGIIKNNQGLYNYEDYQKIVNYFDTSLDTYKNIPILKYSGKKSFNINDIYILDSYLPISSKLNMISIIKLLQNYNPIVEDYLVLYLDTLMLTAYNEMYTEPLQMYKYKVIHFTDFQGTNEMTNTDIYKIKQRIYHYTYLIDSYYYLTELVMEVGDINE